MSEHSINKSEKATCFGSTALMVALLLGLLICLCDGLVMTLYESPRPAMLLRIFEPLSAKIIMIVLLYVVLWFPLLYFMGQTFKLDAEALSVSLGAFILTAYVLYMVNNPISGGSLRKNLFSCVIVCGNLLTVLVFSWATYSATKLISKSKWRLLLVALCLAVPYLLTQTIIFFWVQRCLIAPLPKQFGLLGRKLLSFPVIVTSIIYLISIVATLTAFLLLRFKRTPVRLLLVLALLIFSGSIFSLLLGSDLRLGSKVCLRTGHDVKRVILIIIDTLRADVLSCYGGHRIATPNIDQFAKDAILFKKAFSSAPWTTPSVASTMTGLSPFVHMTTDYKSVLPDALTTLAERMFDDGYLTHAIGDNPVLAHRNFWQGFIGYNFFPKHQDLSPCGRVLSRLFPRRFSGSASTSDLTRLAVDWIDSNVDKDFFLWIHYFDPHAPYEPPAEYLPDKKPPLSMGTSFDGKGSVRGGFLKLTAEQREWVRILYDSEVRYVDENVGLLLDHLKKLRIYDDTLIVLTSDHGEEFWEHNSWEHGHSLYNEQLLVPLIIKLPEPSLRTTVARAVSTECIMPTILQLCQTEYDHEHISSDSLVSTWSASEKENSTHPIVCTGVLYYEEKVAVIFDNLKYIRSLVTGRQEFYELADDPCEELNVAHLFEAEVNTAKQILTEYYKATEKLRKLHSIEKPQEAKLDVDTKRQLKSLGYVQ